MQIKTTFEVMKAFSLALSQAVIFYPQCFDSKLLIFKASLVKVATLPFATESLRWHLARAD